MCTITLNKKFKIRNGKKKDKIISEMKPKLRGDQGRINSNENLIIRRMIRKMRMEERQKNKGMKIS